MTSLIEPPLTASRIYDSLLQVSLEAGSSHAKRLKADIAKLEGETYEQSPPRFGMHVNA
jgi:hypothetical protein